MQWRRLGILLVAVIGVHLAAACGNGQTSGAGASSASSSSGSTADGASSASSSGATTGSGASSSSSSSSATSSSSSSGAAPHHCVRSCNAPADCCAPGQVGCPGNYPKNPTCEQNVCKPPQCASDTDCNFGAMTGYVCKLTNGLKACLLPCAMDTDCSGAATCSGKAADMSKYCAVVEPPCANDVDCGAGGKCLNSACVCSDDTYCAGYGHCQAAACVCTVDTECTGFVNHCAP